MSDEPKSAWSKQVAKEALDRVNENEQRRLCRIVGERQHGAGLLVISIVLVPIAVGLAALCIGQAIALVSS